MHRPYFSLLVVAILTWSALLGVTFPPQMSRGSIGGFRSGVTPEEVLWQAKAGDGTPMSRS
jgi:hypothetical protein